MASNPEALSAHLQRRDDGIWYSNAREKVSYLEDGNDVFFELEEKSFWFCHRNACVRAVVERFAPAGTIYDIGGGNGIVARALVDAGFDTVLVEPGQTGACNARKRGIETVICASLATANFEATTLPAAGIFDVLEHIKDDEDFLREVNRCLIPEGRLYLTVPACEFLWSDDDVRAGHFRRYRLKDVLALLHRAGFAPLYATYFFAALPAPLFFLRSLPSFFGRRRLAPQGYSRLHAARGGGFMESVWARELARIQQGRRILFGSSCLVAAEKRSI